MNNSYYELSELYEKRYPRLNILFKEFNDFLSTDTQSTDSTEAFSYIHNYYKGVRRDIPYDNFITSSGDIFLSRDNKTIQCDNNKKSVYTLQEIEDYKLPITKEFGFQNIDFLLLIVPILLKNSSKKDVLKFLFEFYLNEKVEIREGHEYLGKLDSSYKLDDPRIKFRDDKKFQTFSYLIFHKSIDLDQTWIYKNIIPLAKTMGIHIELVSVNEDNCIEYFDSLSSKCYNDDICDERLIVSNHEEFYNMTYHDCYDCC